VFQACTNRSAPLPPQHPICLEALFRLKATEHGTLYRTPKTPDAKSITADPKSFPQQLKVQAANKEWFESPTPDSPDIEEAVLEQCGIEFERSTLENTPESWAAGWKGLSVKVTTNKSFSDSTRSTLALIVLESYYHEENYSSVFAQYSHMLETYPMQIPTIGTASYFAWASCRGEDKTANRRRIMFHILGTFPPDSTAFPTLDYYAFAVYERSKEMKGSGELSSQEMIKWWLKGHLSILFFQGVSFQGEKTMTTNTQSIFIAAIVLSIKLSASLAASGCTGIEMYSAPGSLDRADAIETVVSQVEGYPAMSVQWRIQSDSAFTPE